MIKPTKTMYDIADVRAVARRIVEAQPDARNPVRPHSSEIEWACVYTDEDDPSRHCLAGAILLDLGLRLPQEMARAHTTPDREQLTGRAANYLTRLQSYADYTDDDLTRNPHEDKSLKLPWGKALSMAEDEHCRECWTGHDG